MNKHGSFNGVIIAPKDTLDSIASNGLFSELTKLVCLSGKTGTKERLIFNPYGGLSIGTTSIHIHKTGMYIWNPHSVSLIRYRRAFLIKVAKDSTDIRLAFQAKYKVKRLWRETIDSDIRGVRIMITDGRPVCLEVEIERDLSQKTRHSIMLWGGDVADKKT